MPAPLIRIIKNLFLALLLGTLALPSSAIEDKQLSLEQQLRQSPGRSVDDIARQIRRDNNWRILAAEPRIIEEKTFYRFKLLNRKRGRVKVIEVEAGKANTTEVPISNLELTN